LNKDPLIQDFNRDIIIKVLDYYNNGDLDFISKDNYKEVFEIFFHFGSEIGILFDYYAGIVIKKLNVLKNINLQNNKSIKDYDNVILFNRDIYNYDNKKKYNILFDMYFDILEFNLDILNYDNYNISWKKISNNDPINNNRYRIKLEITYEFNNIIKLPNKLTHVRINIHKYSLTVKKCEEIENSILKVLPRSLSHLTFGKYSNFNQEIKDNDLPDSLTHLTFGYYFNQEIKENVFPESLTHLTFGYNYNQQIKENVLL
jgi:hypothetical protein